MKILIIKTFPLSFDDWDNIGTLEREISIYKKIQETSNYEISFFSFGGKSEKKYDSVIKPLKFYYQKKKYHNRFIDIILSFLIPFYQNYAFKKTDVIQSNQFWGSWIGLIAAKLYKKKFILREGFQFYEFQKNLNNNKIIRLFILKILSKIIYKFSNIIIVTSNEHKEYIVNNFKINNAKIKVIPNFVDTNLFKKKIETVKDNKLLVVGRLNKQKNIELIIEAIANSKYEVDIIGSGDKSVYEDLINKYNSRVNFIFNVKNKDLVYHYNRCSFYIMCSHFEGNPKTLLEAMSCECAIIATKNKGIIENINDKCAFLIDNNPKSLKKILDNNFDNEITKKNYGKKARELIIQNNDIEKISIYFIEIYNKFHA